MAVEIADADFAEVQEWYLESLNGFVDRYPRTPEAAQAWLQLALSKEFEDKDREALSFYKRVAELFPGTDAGEKAAGAVRRLESVGKPLTFGGTSIDGRRVDLSRTVSGPIEGTEIAAAAIDNGDAAAFVERLRQHFQDQ